MVPVAVELFTPLHTQTTLLQDYSKALGDFEVDARDLVP